MRNDESSERGKEGPREDREGSRQRKGEEDSRLEITVQKRTQFAEGGSEKMEPGQRKVSTERSPADFLET